MINWMRRPLQRQVAGFDDRQTVGWRFRRNATRCHLRPTRSQQQRVGLPLTGQALRRLGAIEFAIGDMISLAKVPMSRGACPVSDCTESVTKSPKPWE